jgi:TPR repeat protein
MKSASGDVTDAQNKLALCYFHGEGITKDVNQAVIWWKKAANLGNVEAMINLASRYLDDSIKHGGDASECKYWWTKAAEAGDAYAMYKLGGCFEYAIGIATSNIPEAYRWYKLAADNGYEIAKKEIKNFKMVKGKIKKIN